MATCCSPPTTATTDLAGQRPYRGACRSRPGRRPVVRAPDCGLRSPDAGRRPGAPLRPACCWPMAPLPLNLLGTPMSTRIAAGRGAFNPRCCCPAIRCAPSIAATLLDDAVEVTRVRGMAGFHRALGGQPVSVMGTGMGIPSASIYATELVREYGILPTGADRHLRRPSPRTPQLGDIVLAQGACTEFRGPTARASAAWTSPRSPASTCCPRSRPRHHAQGGSRSATCSAPTCSPPDPALLDTPDAMGVLGIDMKPPALYGIAAQHRVPGAGRVRSPTSCATAGVGHPRSF